GEPIHSLGNIGSGRFRVRSYTTTYRFHSSHPPLQLPTLLDCLEIAFFIEWHMHSYSLFLCCDEGRFLSLSHGRGRAWGNSLLPTDGRETSQDLPVGGRLSTSLAHPLAFLSTSIEGSAG